MKAVAKKDTVLTFITKTNDCPFNRENIIAGTVLDLKVYSDESITNKECKRLLGNRHIVFQSDDNVLIPTYARDFDYIEDLEVEF